MKFILGVLVVVLLIAHQDNWNWEDPTLVGGIVPIGLAYHAGISMAAAFVWYLATLFVWPKDEDFDSTDSVGKTNTSAVKEAN